MKLSTWDQQVVNNYLNNNANNINYRGEIEEMFNNNTKKNVNLNIEADFNNSQLGMVHVDQNLNFSSFGSFLAGKFVTDWKWFDHSLQAGKNYWALSLLLLCVVVVFGNVLVILSVAKVSVFVEFVTDL